jgi:Domain of unknown function (DUF1788)
MSDALTERLNRVLPKVTSPEFLSGSGIGNEIAFYVFDYPPEDDLRVREHVQFLLSQAPKHRPGLRVSHVNLLALLVDYLKGRNLLDRSIKMQIERGDEQVLKALAPILDAQKVAPVFAAAARPESHDLVLVTGVGSVWPVLRSHTLLNNLHALMGKTPLVMFYPGRYDGQSLRLFGKVKSNNYYRAFKLVP